MIKKCTACPQALPRVVERELSAKIACAPENLGRAEISKSEPSAGKKWTATPKNFDHRRGVV